MDSENKKVDCTSIEPRGCESSSTLKRFPADNALESGGGFNHRTAIWVITPGGLILGEKLLLRLPSSRLFVSKTIADAWPIPDSPTTENNGAQTSSVSIFEKLSTELEQQFRSYSAHICIFSTGIAVRLMGRLIKSKLSDPAVVVMDDQGNHAISLLSGHLGGANELADTVARLTGATAVITTATDVNGLPSIDMVAKKANLHIENPEMIKRVNLSFLQQKKILLIDHFNILLPLIPSSFIALDDTSNRDAVTVFCSDLENAIPPTHEDTDSVSRETLILRPKSLVAGMGCNRNTSCNELMSLLKETFKVNGFSLASLFAIATTQVKADEKGLLELSEILNIPLYFYEKEELNSVQTIQNPSDMVEKHLGVKSVCEAAAILATHNGNLILPKIKKGNATIAVARKEASYL